MSRVSSLGAVGIEITAGTSGLEAGIAKSKGLLAGFVAATGLGGAKTVTAMTAISKSVHGISAAFSALKVVAVGALAALGVAKLGGSFMGAAKHVDDLGKAAKRLHITVETMSGLAFFAEDQGVEVETLTKLVGKLNLNLGKAVRDSMDPAAEALNTLGLSATDASGKLVPLETLLPQIAKQLSSIDNAPEQARLSQALFGREGGQSFIQLLGETGEGFDKLGVAFERARRLGVIFTKDQAQLMDELGDAIDRIKSAWLGVQVTILTKVAPAVIKMADYVATFIAAIPRLSSNLGELFQSGYAGNKRRGYLIEFFHEAWQLFKDIFFYPLQVLFENTIDDLGAQLLVIVADIKAAMLSVAVDLGYGDKLTQKSYDAMSWSEMLTDAEKFRQKREEVSPISNEQRWSQVGINIATSFGYAAKALDRLVGYSDAMSDLSVAAEDVAKAVTDIQVASIRAKTDLEKFHGGVRGALREINEQMRNTETLGASVTHTLIEGLGSGLSDALLDNASDWKKLGKAIRDVLNDVARQVQGLVLKFALMRAIAGGFSYVDSQFGGSGYANQAGYAGETGGVGDTAVAARGAVREDGRTVYAMANGGVVSGPHIFSGAAGANADVLAGENPNNPLEAWMPIAKVNGRLGVAAANGGGTNITIIDQRGQGAPIDVQTGRGPGGEEVVRILVRDEVVRMADSGRLDRTFRNNFGIARKG